MSKKITFRFTLIFFAIIYISFSANGQNTITESFDGTNFLPSGWSSVGNTNLWSRRTSGTFPTCTNHSGAGMVRFASRGVAAKTFQTISTPSIDYSNRGSNTPKITLWIYRDNGSTQGDSLSLYINTSASLSSAAFLGTIARYSKLAIPDTVAANNWYQYTFNIPTGFNSSTNYILFKGISEGGFNIYLDDVQWDEFPNQCTGTPIAGTINATNSIICGGSGSSTLTLNGQTTGFSGITFQWKSSSSATGPFTNIGTNSTSVSTGNISSTRYYKCIATCSFSGKMDSTITKTISVVANPNPTITISPLTANYCAGSNIPVELKASSINNVKKYVWSPTSGLNRSDSSAVNSKPSANTTYSVIGTDSMGCTGSANITVNLRQPPFVTITSIDSNICQGDSLRLTANTGGGGNTYLWSPTGQTSNVIYAKPNANSSYNVEVKNNFGCITKVSKNLYVALKPTAKFGFIQTGNKLSFIDSSRNASNYLWDFGDGSFSKKPKPVYIYPIDGDYTITLIVNSPPCKSDTMIKNVNVNSSSINAIHGQNGISITPNPSQNIISINFQQIEDCRLTIFNSIGEIILIKTINNTKEILDISNFPNGIYTFNIENKSESFNYKIMKY